jgi:hypothetical protein
MLYSSTGDKRAALLMYQRAFRLARDVGSNEDVANLLCNLAQIYFDLGRLGASRRSLGAADRIASKFQYEAIRVRIRILAGEILEVCGDLDSAERAWKEGLDTAKRIGDATLMFKVKFFLYRAARASGRPALAKKLASALRNLSPWIPESTEELRLFSKLADDGSEDAPTRVA